MEPGIPWWEHKACIYLIITWWNQWRCTETALKPSKMNTIRLKQTWRLSTELDVKYILNNIKPWPFNSHKKVQINSSCQTWKLQPEHTKTGWRVLSVLLEGGPHVQKFSMEAENLWIGVCSETAAGKQPDGLWHNDHHFNLWADN